MSAPTNTNKQIQNNYFTRLQKRLYSKSENVIISKPHTYLQTNTKTPAKLLNDWKAIQGEVAHTIF